MSFGSVTVGQTSPHPYARQPMRRQLRVPDRVPDLPVAEEILDQPRIQPFVGEHVTGAVTEHVWVDVEPDLSGLRCLGDDPCHHVRADRAAALADEHAWPVHNLPQLPQSGDLIAVDRVRAVLRSFDPLDVEGRRSRTCPP